jgi:hypothetical protein
VLTPTFTLKRQIAGFISGQVLLQLRDAAMMTFLDEDCEGETIVECLKVKLNNWFQLSSQNQAMMYDGPDWSLGDIIIHASIMASYRWLATDQGRRDDVKPDAFNTFAVLV